MSVDTLKKEGAYLVHQVLGHSYLVYFTGLVLGIILDVIFPIRVFPAIIPYFGLLFIVIGSCLVYWAQQTAWKSRHERQKAETICRDSFCVGPYRFTRIPTQYGLVFLTLGLAFLINSLIVFCASLIAFLITRTFFIPREEEYLESRYGDAFREYKKHVKF